MIEPSSNQNSYGISQREDPSEANGKQLEQLRNLGFCVISGVVEGTDLDIARKKLDAVYEKQLSELSHDFLERILELDMARMPFAYDDWFVRLITNEKILELARAAVGDYIILHLQNGIINRPAETHHQSSWHRDLPYQDWVISRPLAVSALYCLDDFTVETGGTLVLPHSHRLEKFPSPSYVEEFQKQVLAKAGSVIVFDSMLFHRAGINSSIQIRRGINHVYTVPLLKQQIDIPSALQGRLNDDSKLARLLGYECQVAPSVVDWRKIRHRKMTH